jgi:hypothetical protein
MKALSRLSATHFDRLIAFPADSIRSFISSQTLKHVQGPGSIPER